MTILRHHITPILLGLCLQSCNKIVYEYQSDFTFYKNYKDVSLILPDMNLAVSYDSVFCVTFPDTNVMVKITDQSTVVQLHNILNEAWNESIKRRIEYNDFLLRESVGTVKYTKYFLCGLLNTVELTKSYLVWKYDWQELDDENWFSLWLINLQGDSLRSVVCLSSFWGIGEDHFWGIYSPDNVTYRDKNDQFKIYEYNLFSRDKWLCFPKHEYCLFKINESGYIELIPDTPRSPLKQVCLLRNSLDEQRYNKTVKLFYERRP